MQTRHLTPCHMNSVKDKEGFEYFLNQDIQNLLMLEAWTLPIENDVVIEDLKKCKEHKKFAHIYFQDYIYVHDNKIPYRCTFKENWKEILDDVDKACTEAGGEYFWGYFIDEPLYYMSGEQYLELTKYMSKYNKRILTIHGSIHIHKALWPCDDYPGIENCDTITPEMHEYTTDVAYDFYGAWEFGVHHNTVYKLFIEKLGKRFDKMNFWFTPPVGTVLPEWAKDEAGTEQINIDVFNGMLGWAKKHENFAGFFLYTYMDWLSPDKTWSHGNAKKYLIPDENGNVKWERMYKIIERVGLAFNEGKDTKEIDISDLTDPAKLKSLDQFF